ncbi:MAG: S9 family peptidase [Chloroflexi bacterium]|nr:S9 family peptidase [Chloroflexota bacterium]MBP7044068.1 S9 family peptidase [Chloroflexota bacterium]
MSHQPITLEDVATYPLPGTAVPASLAFSPDGRLVTYLFSGANSLSQQLWAYDPETAVARTLITPPGGGDTEESLSPEEKLRRERLRQHSLGITRYTWGKNGRLLIPLQGSLYLQNGPDADLELLVDGNGSPLLDARFSPDGGWVSFVQDCELYVLPVADGSPRQLTREARGTGRTHGLAEYIAQEEMARREGYWWSPDSQWLAFTEVDETHIPVYRIVHQGKDQTGDAAQEDHRYPFAGQANAKVRLAVVNRDGGDPIWLDLGDDEDIYLARVNWLPNGRLTAQIENRAQTRLDLVEFDVETGAKRTLLTETSDVWINLHDLFTPLQDGRFLWGSERTGFMHLYLYDGDGRLERPLTQGDWLVTGVTAVDEKAQLVYFTGTADSPLETHLYVVPFTGGAPRRLTREPGTHSPIIDLGRQRFLDAFQSQETPPCVRLCALSDGTTQQTIYANNDPRLPRLTLQPPEIVTLPSRDGVELIGAIYRPPVGVGPFPAIVHVYGGPHAQMVTDSWRVTANMRAQYLAQQGFLVFMLDNRGSARRGLAFEGWIKGRMGIIEVQDQVDGVRWLVEQGLADPARVGIYGWSYGGYMAAMCLAQAPDTFQVAVAGAPVTHYDGYDTHYTERYMGTPQANPDGYTAGSVMVYVDKLTGKLLLVHGLIDENVHFRHTARLINALIRARKPYDLLLFPNERHSPRGLADRMFMEEQIRDYFVRNL